MKNELIVKEVNINFFSLNEKDFISLTDIARYKNPLEPKDVVKNWMRNYSTIEFLGIWEEIYNPNFNSPEFEGIKNQAGLNRFTLSVKQWAEKTNSKGIIAKARFSPIDPRT